MQIKIALVVDDSKSARFSLKKLLEKRGIQSDFAESAGDALNYLETHPPDVIFIPGVGEVYPYIRSHNVLNNLQSTAKDHPTLMFFPGRYTHALATGASLDLFGILHDDKYYRAFNILNYEV